jgi:hypothetical protein
MGKKIDKFLNYYKALSPDCPILLSFPKSGNTKVRLSVSYGLIKAKSENIENIYYLSNIYCPEAGRQQNFDQAIMIKTHSILFAYFAKKIFRKQVIGIIRKPAECIQSYDIYCGVRGIKLRKKAKNLHNWLRITNFLTKNATFILKYEEVLENDRTAIETLSRILKIDSNDLIEGFYLVSKGIRNPNDDEKYSFFSTTRSESYEPYEKYFTSNENLKIKSAILKVHK